MKNFQAREHQGHPLALHRRVVWTLVSWLRWGGRPPHSAEARLGIARVKSLSRAARQVGWCHDTEQGLTTIDTMADLDKAISGSISNPDIGTDATAAFVSYLENQRTRENEAGRSRRAERVSALRENAHRILKQATYVSLARQDTLFGTDSPR